VLVLRILALLVVVTIGASAAAFLATRDRRYLRFAWQTFKYSVIVALLILVLMALERLLVAL
jgi:uncharacterized membrane protein YgdD (TMEM256/DUF423 family)